MPMKARHCVFAAKFEFSLGLLSGFFWLEERGTSPSHDFRNRLAG
jgi:hypothetical protein